MKKISVKINIWGNYGCFIGGRKEDIYGGEWDATYWLSKKLATGEYKLSSNSDISMANVEAFNEKLK